MPFLHKCKYPVVDPDPSFEKCVSNFHLKDWGVIGAWMSSGYAVGWFIASKPLRVHNARYLAANGLLAGLSYSYLSATQRFMGIYPNESELARYGAASPETIEEFERHSDTPNLELIDAMKFKRN